MKDEYRIEKVIISLRTVTILLFAFIIGYTLKLKMTFETAFIKVVSLQWLRFVGAFFISLVVANGLLIVSIHKHKNKLLPLMFCFMDMITLIMVFSSG